MYLPLKIASRYFFSKKNQKYFGFLTLLSVLGIFISVLGFLVVDGVLNGFSQNIQKALLGFDSNLVIQDSGVQSHDKLNELLTNHSDVEFFQDVAEFDSLIYKEGHLLGALKIRGVAESVFSKQPSVKLFSFELSNLPQGGLFYLGEDFFSRAMISPSTEQKLMVLNPFGDVSPSGDFIPVSDDWSVGGFFSTGHFDFDATYGFIPLNQALKICGINCQKSTLVYYKKGVLDSSLENDLLKLGYKFETWKQKNKMRYAALKLEKLGIFFLLTLVLMIASINIFSLVSLISFKKMKENILFWILGLSAKKVRSIYLCYAALLGLAGALPGVIIALGLLLYLKMNPIGLPSAYYLSSLPVVIDPIKFLCLLILAPLLAVVTGLWPAFQTTREFPIRVLQKS